MATSTSTSSSVGVIVGSSSSAMMASTSSSSSFSTAAVGPDAATGGGGNGTTTNPKTPLAAITTATTKRRHRTSLSVHEKSLVKSFCEQQMAHAKTKGNSLPSQDLLRQEITRHFGWEVGRSTLSKILCMDWHTLQAKAPSNPHMKRKRKPLFPQFEADLVQFIQRQIASLQQQQQQNAMLTAPFQLQMDAMNTNNTDSTSAAVQALTSTGTNPTTTTLARSANGLTTTVGVITEALILEEAQRLKQEHGIKDQELVLSVGWLSRFKYRNGIRLRKNSPMPMPMPMPLAMSFSSVSAPGGGGGGGGGMLGACSINTSGINGGSGAGIVGVGVGVGAGGMDFNGNDGNSNGPFQAALKLDANGPSANSNTISNGNQGGENVFGTPQDPFSAASQTVHAFGDELALGAPPAKKPKESTDKEPVTTIASTPTPEALPMALQAYYDVVASQKCLQEMCVHADQVSAAEATSAMAHQWTKLNPALRHVVARLPAKIAALKLGCDDTPFPMGIQGLQVFVCGVSSVYEAFLASALVGAKGFVHCVDTRLDNVALAYECMEAFCTQTLGYPMPNLRVCHGFVETVDAMPMEKNAFDLVIANGSFRVAPNKQLVLQQVFSLLKSGGEFHVRDVVCSRRLIQDASSHVHRLDNSTPQDQNPMEPNIQAISTTIHAIHKMTNSMSDASRPRETTDSMEPPPPVSQTAAVNGDRMACKRHVHAVYEQDLRRAAEKAGFQNAVRRVNTIQLASQQHPEQAQEPKTEFYATTLRCFKLSSRHLLEDREEDFGQFATYTGTITYPHGQHQVDALTSLLAVQLDDKTQRFDAHQRIAVSGNTALVLGESWLAPFFQVDGGREQHFGKFTTKFHEL